MNLRLSGFQKLALSTVVATFVMIVIGVVVRSTGSGLGCPDWPLCNGRIIPAIGDDKAWIESIHRWWGVLVGFLVLGLAVAAWRTQRRPRSILAAAGAAVVLTGVQAWLGKWTVESGNSGESVIAHLAVSMLILAVTIFVFVRSRYPAMLPAHGGSQRLTLIIAFAAGAVYALMLFGADVTANAASLVFPDWPLMDGQLIPRFSDDPAAAALQMAHFAHRVVAFIVGLIMLGAAVATWRAARDAQGEAPSRAELARARLRRTPTASSASSGRRLRCTSSRSSSVPSRSGPPWRPGRSLCTWPSELPSGRSWPRQPSMPGTTREP